MRILTYLAAVLFLLVGCSDESNQDAKTPAAPTPLNFVMVSEGSTSGIKADMTSVYKLDTPDSWQKFWHEHHQNMEPQAPAPTIDFNKDMVIAIVDTDQPSSGYQLSIDQLQAVDQNLYVFATRTQPGAGCVSLGMISQPFVILQVPKSDLIPQLRLTTKTVACN